MMSSISQDPPDSGTERQSIMIGMSLEEHRFATTPMSALLLSRRVEQQRFATELMSATPLLSGDQGTLVEQHFATVPMPALCPRQTDQLELAEQSFATEPLFAVRSPQAERLELEEKWHTSFEEAISERVARVSLRLCRLSTTALELESAAPATDPLPAASSLTSLPTRPRLFLAHARRFWQERRRSIVLCCLCAGLFLLGFDLMGLLVALR